MERFINKNGKNLRYGYTTGSCAAAASKAAVIMLITQETVSNISISTPKGWELDLNIVDASISKDHAACGVVKDGGDDPDATHGMTISAIAKRNNDNTLKIKGGTGIGLVTKNGFDQPKGEHAINSIPRQMITSEVKKACSMLGYDGGIEIEIYALEGEEIGKKTFNPRIGILGGISILGTTGIVEPMSEKALIDSLFLEMNVIKENGSEEIFVFPGNYGKQFAKDNLSIDFNKSIKIGNNFGEVLKKASELKFKKIVLVGHIGKMVKLAGGIMNTHSHNSDARMEILAAYASLCGGSRDLTAKILDCAACDDALTHLKGEGLLETVMKNIAERIEHHVRFKLGDGIRLGLVVFSNEFGILAINDEANSLKERCV
ncbi:cobalt-precorrin-5B (C(1))-methyltransferase CbiD [Alkalibacter mobilis]|uniref:cobalt-precorrin-5B (C(1))-methyltransferase CbiD n=1 Tax=Alkalibacter mobilis TaxID=2787712 RepID=UPI00189E9D7B|nr:cobalt-precorrin-5B (C(1))-methyltransferase CbiD [Alkalibacter mobilis]MBF7097172.1 cobalamin biosynthesis protein CbiD [Alkalibacter mobilis]